MKRSVLLLLLSVLLLSTTACSRVWLSVEQAWQEAIARRDAARNADKIIRKGKSLVGRKYRYGSAGPRTFDCSGYTMACYRAAGIRLPRATAAQRDYGRRLPPGAPLQKGDLVFFAARSGRSSAPGHVGIVVSYRRRDGSFTFLHASVSNGVELQSSEAPYYKARYLYASRVLPDL